ncbi:hypothetical protein BHUM_00425c [Candidatus Burkholderia humilis]|nr:hypothetical protein BHUM_00425c [Candidatus Burkholderia humilis]
MYVCYIHESGCLGAIDRPDHAGPTPVFAIAGLFVHRKHLDRLTNGFLALKRRYFPNNLPAGARPLDWIIAEVKGTTIRNMMRDTGRNNRRHAWDTSARIWIYWSPSMPGSSRASTSNRSVNRSMASRSIPQAFSRSRGTFIARYLAASDAQGLIVADSRSSYKSNVNVAHSIFTQWRRVRGDAYPRLIELPFFGHSDNHTGLQLTDVLCSGVLFSIAAQVCCAHHYTIETHASAHWLIMRARLGARLSKLEYRYQDTGDKWSGGIALSDPMNRYAATILLNASTPTLAIRPTPSPAHDRLNSCSIG